MKPGNYDEYAAIQNIYSFSINISIREFCLSLIVFSAARKVLSLSVKYSFNSSILLGVFLSILGVGSWISLLAASSSLSESDTDLGLLLRCESDPLATGGLKHGSSVTTSAISCSYINGLGLLFPVC